MVATLRKAEPVPGWANYRRIFHDPTFWVAWRNTLEFTVLALIIGYAVPFAVAILLNELRHAKGYLRCLVYLPVMLPPTAALLLFAYFYHPTYGLFNDILHTFHLPTSQWVQSAGTTPPTMAMISVVIAATWMNMGGATLIYLAALQNIPGELYEAAELDGAGLYRKIRLREVIDGTLAFLAAAGAPPTWVLSNHDVDRHVSRYGRLRRPARPHRRAAGQRPPRRRPASPRHRRLAPRPRFRGNVPVTVAGPDQLLVSPLVSSGGEVPGSIWALSAASSLSTSASAPA
jgi:ABC-type amino acid transport system permease subunit